MKKYLLLASLGFLAFTVQSQTHRNYDYHLFDLKTINPAFAGIEEKYSISFLSSGYELQGAPSNIFMAMDANIEQLNSGLGLVFENNHVGPLNFSNLIFNYNYHLNINKSSRLILGTGVKRAVTSFSLSIPSNPSDPVFISSENSINLDLDFGIAYILNDLSLGISVINLLNSEQISTGETLNNPRLIHNYIAYDFKINKSFELKPAVFISINELDNNYEFNLMSRIFQYLSLGFNVNYLGDRTDLALIAGINWNDNIELFSVLYSNQRFEGRLNDFSRFQMGVRVNITE